MANFFPRFGKRWASTGTVVEPTDTQADTGFAHLGPNPPTVEEFNALFQQSDEKDNWLYGHLAAVMSAGGVTPASGSTAGLQNALVGQFPGLAAGGRSLVNPGYIRLPGGLLLQWFRNRVGSTDGNGSMTIGVNFPVAYNTAVLGYSVVANDESTYRNDTTATVVAASVTQIVVGVKVPGATNGTLAAVSGFVIGV